MTFTSRPELITLLISSVFSAELKASPKTAFTYSEGKPSARAFSAKAALALWFNSEILTKPLSATALVLVDLFEELSVHASDGITNPPIDELLDKAGSKYNLVIFSAKRARQINAYYSQLGEGLLEYVGPLVETHVHEKPLSIAMREINEGLLTIENLEPQS